MSRASVAEADPSAAVVEVYSKRKYAQRRGRSAYGDADSSDDETGTGSVKGEAADLPFVEVAVTMEPRLVRGEATQLTIEIANTHASSVCIQEVLLTARKGFVALFGLLRVDLADMLLSSARTASVRILKHLHGRVLPQPSIDWRNTVFRRQNMVFEESLTLPTWLTPSVPEPPPSTTDDDDTLSASSMDDAVVPPSVTNQTNRLSSTSTMVASDTEDQLFISPVKSNDGDKGSVPDPVSPSSLQPSSKREVQLDDRDAVLDFSVSIDCINSEQSSSLSRSLRRRREPPSAGSLLKSLQNASGGALQDDTPNVAILDLTPDHWIKASKSTPGLKTPPARAVVFTFDFDDEDTPPTFSAGPSVSPLVCQQSLTSASTGSETTKTACCETDPKSTPEPTSFTTSSELLQEPHSIASRDADPNPLIPRSKSASRLSALLQSIPRTSSPLASAPASASTQRKGSFNNTRPLLAALFEGSAPVTTETETDGEYQGLSASLSRSRTMDGRWGSGPSQLRGRSMSAVSLASASGGVGPGVGAGAAGKRLSHAFSVASVEGGAVGSRFGWLLGREDAGKVEYHVVVRVKRERRHRKRRGAVEEGERVVEVCVPVAVI
ncbi:hypothetical protein BC830DRAFT_1168559 [Chytriomyces sp. MP71]|nr:hypothetical protein BC830DRAFT_1168559 [Chytriomyces sp. MP71]